MTRLRAGLVGVGMMGRHHARVLGSLDGVDLVAVVDPGGDPHGVATGRDLHRLPLMKLSVLNLPKRASTH
jgi:UDP-N-acetylglucosamine 3-dehydrogenase